MICNAKSAEDEPDHIALEVWEENLSSARWYKAMGFGASNVWQAVGACLDRGDDAPPCRLITTKSRRTIAIFGNIPPIALMRVSDLRNIDSNSTKVS